MVQSCAQVKAKKAKSKTKGPTLTDVVRDGAPQADFVVSNTNPKPKVFNLKRRICKGFNAILHNPLSPDRPGEIPWTKFLYAMSSVDFVPQKVYGLVWQFMPTDASLGRSIHSMSPILAESSAIAVRKELVDTLSERTDGAQRICVRIGRRAERRSD